MRKKRSQRRSAPSYSKLEDRHLLAGDFTLVGDVLVLNGFQDSSATQPNTLIVERFSSESVFTLTDGTWNGVQGFGRTLSQGGTVLTVDITLGQLLISSTTPDQFDIEFGDVVSDRDIRIEGNSNSDAASFGSITQQADTEIVFSDFFSPVFSVSGAESVDLQNPRNSFGTVEIDNATSASIVTRSNLVVNGATVANQLQLTAGALDTSPGSGFSNGQLTLNGNITAGSQVLLQASEGVNQASGIITTDQLFIGGDAANESSGEFSLNQANLVDELTADVSFEFNNTTNSLALTNAQDLAIVAGTFTSVLDPSVSESFDGVRVGENLQLDVTGSLQQTTGLIDIGGVTTFEATGDIELPGVDNNGNGIEDNSFEFDPQLNAGGDIVFATNGDVTAATLVAGGSVTLATSNDLTITPELVEGGGSFGFVANRITIDTDIVADQLLLQAANGVEATFGNTVDVSDLLLVGAGEFNLESGLNSIDNLATSIVGELELGNSVDLTVADLTFDSGSQDVNVSGLTVDGRLDGVTIPTTFSVARLEVTGSLFLTEQVDVLGDFSLSLRPVTAVPIEGIVGRRADLIALPEVDLNTSSLFFSVGGQVSLGDVTAPRSASIFSGDGGISLLTLQAEAGVNLQAGFFTNVGSGDLTVGSVEASDGDVFLTAVDGVNIGDVLASRELTILSEEGSIISNRVVSSNGSVEISSGANLNVQEVQAAVDVSLDAAGNNLFSGSVISGSVAELVSAGNQTALQVIAAEEAIITAEIDLRVNDIQADQVTIEAGDDIFDAQFRDGLGVQTDSLVVRAGNSNNEGTSGGIVLETDVNSLSAIVEGEGFGNIIIRELDDVVLGDIETGDGQITITAGGTISEGDIRTRVRTDQSDVRLIATGDESDIRIDEINVGNAGDVFLIADDDVVISGDGVTANSVFVRANNRSAGGTDGIALSTNIVSAQLIVGDPNDAVQNRGDISITDENSLSVDFARTLVGTVSVTTEGSLIAANVQSEGVNQTDAISLRATGEGADVVTGRVVVRNQAGGIQLTADDDVRDSNLQDGLMVIADSFTVFAGNNSDDNFNGINSQSRVRSVSATVENGEAAILVDNTGFLSVNQATLSSGFVRINNRVGSVSINDIALSGSSSNNRVFVNTFADNADILVGRIDAGGGNVVLDSADDIFDTDLLDDLFVEGIFLLATSRNGNIGAFDGVVLDVDVDSFFADAQLSGQEFVRQRA